MNRLPLILAFGPGTWRPGQVCGSPRYHLWNLAALGWRVLYVEPPVRLPRRTAVWDAPDRPLSVLTPGGIPPFAVRWCLMRGAAELWREGVARRLARETLRCLDGWRCEPDLLWFGSPWHGALLRHLPRVPRAVHIYDELARSPLLRPTPATLLDEWERHLLANCDVALCSSRPQAEARRDLCPRTEVLENGIPEQFLGESPRDPSGTGAAELLTRIDNLPRPRVAYGGVADLRLDPEPFLALLDEERIGSVLFLGGRGAMLDRKLRRALRRHPRAFFTGPVPHGWYPALYRRADCLAIAHRDIHFTRAMLPEKLSEYMGSGKPVVAMELPEIARVAREADDPLAVRLARSPEDFVDQCVAACRDTEPALAAERRRLAGRRTWGKLAAELDAVLRGMVRL